MKLHYSDLKIETLFVTCLSVILIFLLSNLQAPALAEQMIEKAVPTAASVKPHLTDISVENPNAIEKPLVQLAILLDTSGSMDGLINQARSKIWNIVNHFATSSRGGVKPRIEVALFEYGKATLPSSEGYLKMICPLTTDLDLVSEELFKLVTNGGDEYCGWVIRSATQGLAWSPKPRDYKAIFIAGNESFAQGQVQWKESCAAAVKRGVIVNTIFCGSDNGLEASVWKEGATAADGEFSSIDQNVREVAIAAPQDQEISTLNSVLNSTYMAYGSGGAKFSKRQAAQDTMAASLAPSVLAQRVQAKASAAYSNSAWDLVDAQKEGKVSLEAMEEDSMPAELKGKTMEEKREIVDNLAQKRTEVQAKIKKLTEERERFVAEKKKNSAETGTSLDAAIIDAVTKQAAARGFSFEKGK
ncbi:MAG: hypothetical protein CVV64_15120 [Candidatus Wallbacteria bacterium HGW-Wallbacteria-1]|uniref:VWFA domain-containing protein n=1 Tax=Candidatus Wallbacteria bacterium HGW-Wallbacteria-1 TaxID=2013854 RepID=A0A2N1PLP0_9BACT|nr:MAG: hypothetical protein CVV64_15120 [Candidatus Wallbacteria bacterium HGW-Wallbacteria-1]